jgi:hypothetical protein
MNKIQLTKKEYLGEGYVLFYKHKVTGERKVVHITEKEYQNISINTPQEIDNYTYEYAVGEVVKVDNENQLIDFGEYCDFEDGYYVVARDNNNFIIAGKYGKEVIINDELNLSLIN